jgi:tripartite ATP-independent transporter DctP family solute receptor
MTNRIPRTSARAPKKNLFRYVQFSVAAVAALSLAGCGLSEPVASGDSAAAENADTRVLKLAHVYEASHPMEVCGVTALQRELEGSGLSIESFPSGQLGSEAESLEQVALGGLDLAIAGPSFLGVWHDEAAVLDGAYLFDSVDHFAKTIAGPTMAKIYDEMSEETGIKVLSGWYYGTRQVTSNKEINSPDDLQGVKIRTPDAPLYLSNTKVMGGTATPMALGEVYLALQQGVIDAQENPIPTIATAKFNEVQDYINITGHMIQGVNIVTNTALFDDLSSEQQTALTDAMDVAADEVRTCVETAEKEILAEWKADGSIIVNENVDRAAFAKRAREMLPDEVTWGDLYKEIQSDK